VYHPFRCPHCDYEPVSDAKVQQCNCPSTEKCLGVEHCSQAKAFQLHMLEKHQKIWG